jgi:hypothetical protein
MDRILFVLFSFQMMFFVSCKSVYSEKDMKIDTISYEALPIEIKEIYLNKKITDSSIKFRVFNFDSSLYKVFVSQSYSGPYADPIIIDINESVKLELNYATPQPYFFINSYYYHPNEGNVFSEEDAQNRNVTFSKIDLYPILFGNSRAEKNR